MFFWEKKPKQNKTKKPQQTDEIKKSKKEKIAVRKEWTDKSEVWDHCMEVTEEPNDARQTSLPIWSNGTKIKHLS